MCILRVVGGLVSVGRIYAGLSKRLTTKFCVGGHFSGDNIASRDFVPLQCVKLCWHR